MSRNPIAKAVRNIRHQVVPDKRRELLERAYGGEITAAIREYEDEPRLQPLVGKNPGVCPLDPSAGQPEAVRWEFPSQRFYVAGPDKLVSYEELMLTPMIDRASEIINREVVIPALCGPFGRVMP